MAASVVVVGGDNQRADPEDALADPIRFRVIDADGKALAGIALQFAIPIGGGSVPEGTVTTDSTGHAQTPWTMGPLGGVQQLEVWVGNKVMATVTATTCEPTECFPPEHLAGPLSSATLLRLATYESSGEAVHPDVVRGHGFATGFWLAITPYPGGNVAYENPSIFRSSNAIDWSIPSATTNPIAKPEASSYLSDPDIVVDADQKLWMFYRSVGNSLNVIKVMRSKNGAQWDSATTVIAVPSHELISPAVVRGAPGTPWQMWSVNAGGVGCAALQTKIERRTSSDGLHWSTPTTINLTQPGQSIWHIDVQWIPARSEYWALYNTYLTGSTCATNALYLARSPDGVNWTVYPSPIARAGLISAFKSLIYRSTFMTNPRATEATLWMSGAVYSNGIYIWNTARVTTTVTDLFAIASVPATLIRDPRPLVRLPPPEPDVGPDHR